MSRAGNRCLTPYLSAIAAVVLLALTGCETRLKTGYGRAFGSEYSTSVNGTVVFQEMVKATGRDVDRYGRISPRWRNYKTVYWIPDGFGAPSDEAIDKAEDWLEADWDRTLVLVGRDFDAEIMYWESLRNLRADDPDRMTDRHLADAATRHLSSAQTDRSRECDWYDTQDYPFTHATKISGPLSQGIDISRADLRYRSLPVPGRVDATGDFGDYEVEVLLRVDSIPFVYSLKKNRWSDSRVVVVGNGTFLLNLPLSNAENRKLAANLIQYIHENDYPFDDVLFIESHDQIAISEQDVDETHTKWGWITHRPLRYIVPNILFWCLLFCFVYFPIFGRPRRINRQSTANFRDHILALAGLMSKTKARNEPVNWIEDYQRRTANKGPRPSDRSLKG